MKPNTAGHIRFLALLAALLCLLGALAGCGRKPEEPPVSPGPVDPALPEHPDRTPPEEGDPEDLPPEIPWPDRAESAAALRELAERGEYSPELVRAFSDYFNYNGRGSELDYLPAFAPGDRLDWDELTYYIAVLAYGDGTALDGLTREVFAGTVSRYLGDISYEDRPSSFLFYDGETYTPTGWDSNGGHWYRLAEFRPLGDGTFHMVLDGVEFREGDWPEDGEAGPNGQKVLDRYPETRGDFSLWRAKYMEMLLEDRYRETFSIRDQVTLTVRLAEGTENVFTYLSCQRTNEESLRPGISFPEQDGWMRLIQESLPEITGIRACEDGEEPVAYGPPEGLWEILRLDDWEFVDRYTCEHYLGIGVPEALLLYSGEEQVLRVMEYEAYGEKKTLVIVDAPIPSEAEGAKIDGMVRFSAPAECYRNLRDALGEPVEDRAGWMDSLRRELPDITAVLEFTDPVSPYTVYLPPEYGWDLLRPEEWTFVDDETYENTMGVGMDAFLILRGEEGDIARATAWDDRGVSRTLLLYDRETAGAEGARRDGSIRIFAPGDCYQDLRDALGDPIGTEE